MDDRTQLILNIKIINVDLKSIMLKFTKDIIDACDNDEMEDLYDEIQIMEYRITKLRDKLYRLMDEVRLMDAVRRVTAL
jgi:predicted  nucleic acid-binding Zn-ribbon protein